MFKCVSCPWVSSHLLLSCFWAPLRRVWLCLGPSLPSGVYIHWENSSKPCPGWTVPAPLAFFHISDASSSSWPFARVSACLSCTGKSSSGHSMPDVPPVLSRREGSPPSVYGQCSAWCSPGGCLASSARTRFWFMASLVSTVSSLQNCFPAAWPLVCICMSAFDPREVLHSTARAPVQHSSCWGLPRWHFIAPFPLPSHLLC